MKHWLKQGPYKIEHEEECLCQNNSNGIKCDSCVSGFFALGESCTRLVIGAEEDRLFKFGKIPFPLHHDPPMWLESIEVLFCSQSAPYRLHQKNLENEINFL